MKKPAIILLMLILLFTGCNIHVDGTESKAIIYYDSTLIALVYLNLKDLNPQVIRYTSGAVNGFDVFNDGKRLLVAESNLLNIYSISGQLIKTINLGTDVPYWPKIAPDGNKFIYYDNSSTYLKIADFNGNILKTITVLPTFKRTCWSPGGDHLLISNDGGNTTLYKIYISDLNTTHTIITSGTALDFAVYSSDGQKIIYNDSTDINSVTYNGDVIFTTLVSADITKPVYYNKTCTKVYYIAGGDIMEYNFKNSTVYQVTTGANANFFCLVP